MTVRLSILSFILVHRFTIRSSSCSVLSTESSCLATAGVILAGAMMTLQDSFSIVDLLMGFMTITNLIAIIWLSPRVVVLLNDYRRKRKEHKDPVFSKSVLPKEQQDDIECW